MLHLKIRRGLAERLVAWKRRKNKPNHVSVLPNVKKGLVIYSNPSAVPVPKEIKALGQREPFALINVEELRISKTLLAEGGNGKVFLGKLKFKGVSSPIRVAIKKYNRGYNQGLFRGVDLQKIIARLKNSRVPQPKMILLVINNIEYVIMEPFIKYDKFQNKVVPKFARTEDILRPLNLRHDFDRKVFEEVAQATASLAKNGLFLVEDRDFYGKRQSVFNYFKLRDGSPKVMVLDLDTLRARDNISQNWVDSAQVLVDAVSVYAAHREENNNAAIKIIEEVAKREGFP